MKSKTRTIAVFGGLLILGLLQINMLVFAKKTDIRLRGAYYKMLDHLSMMQYLRITPADIQAAILSNTDKKIFLGTVSSYSKYQLGNKPLTISTAKGDYQMARAGGFYQQSLKYRIQVNGIDVPYGQTTIISAKKGVKSAGLGFDHEIYLTIAADDLKEAEAGTYMTALNLTAA